jgi:hypothetical protein
MKNLRPESSVVSAVTNLVSEYQRCNARIEYLEAMLEKEKAERQRLINIAHAHIAEDDRKKQLRRAEWDELTKLLFDSHARCPVHRL